jgi:hypothetical protein
MKAIANVLKVRLVTTSETLPHEMQNGFRHGRGCPDRHSQRALRPAQAQAARAVVLAPACSRLHLKGFRPRTARVAVASDGETGCATNACGSAEGAARQG